MKIPMFVAGTMVCAACQTYNTVAIPSLEPNSDVRVTLTSAGSDDVTRLVGPHISALEGRLVSVDTASVKVAVRDLIHTDGSFNMYHDEIVAVPRSAIATTEVKRLSRGRSIVLAAALAAGSTVAATQLGGGEGTRGNSGSGATTTK